MHFKHYADRIFLWLGELYDSRVIPSNESAALA